VGTYSSIFFATPLLVTLRERTELVRTHTRRVLKRRTRSDDSAVEISESTSEEPTEASEAAEPAEASEAPAKAAPSKPAPGARPVRPTGTRRPTGKRNAGRR
jgi:preprotein translocase subunit SecF